MTTQMHFDSSLFNEPALRHDQRRLAVISTIAAAPIAVAIVVALYAGKPGAGTSGNLLVIQLLVLAAGLVGYRFWWAARSAQPTIESADDDSEAIVVELREAQALLRADRALMHEVGSTVAGISSASDLVRTAAGLCPERRAALESMLSAELARLQRLLQPADAGLHTFDLDETIRPLVVSQEARGHHVTWQPTDGLRGIGKPDDVAEVVNILLENAARHGGGEGTRVSIAACDNAIEVVVADAGPGVAREVLPRLFEWEASRASSPGQGIGLHIARQLVEDLGGDLRLDESVVRGATFRVQLPRVRSVISGDHDSARQFAS